MASQLYTQIPAYNASTGAPLSGLTPTWTTFLNASTGSSSVGPTISEVASTGIYQFESTGDSFAGMVDFGATAASRYVAVLSVDVDTLAIFDTSGVPRAGITPTWTSYVENDGTAISPQATFTELSGGIYRIEDLDPDAIGIVDLTSGSSPRYLAFGAPDSASTQALVNLPSMSLSTLRDAIRRRCDIVWSPFFTDEELDLTINLSMYGLYDQMLENFEDAYWGRSTTLTLNSSGVADLPNDFYKIRGVDYGVGNQVYSVQPIQFSERNNWNNFSVGLSTYARDYMSAGGYYLNANTIVFKPVPQNTTSLTLHYFPTMESMILDTDSFNSYSGWIEWVIQDVCVRCMIKEKYDPSPFIFEREKVEARIRTSKANRDATGTRSVADVRGTNRLRDVRGNRGYY